MPGIDDGSPDLETSLEMARLAVADGIEVMACTPHIMAGVYSNSAASIRADIATLADQLRLAGIPLQLVSGADIHLSPSFAVDFASGLVLGLNESRYFLLEPPHHVMPPRLEDFAFAMIAAGHHPILTHPERLTWIEGQYEVVERLYAAGVLMQITGGSLTGRFGRRPQYWAEKMLAEGRVHLLATDAHDTRKRPPLLAEARDAAARLLGNEEAQRLVVTNPLYILQNVLPSELRSASGGLGREQKSFLGWLRQFGGGRTRGKDI